MKPCINLVKPVKLHEIPPNADLLLSCYQPVRCC